MDFFSRPEIWVPLGFFWQDFFKTNSMVSETFISGGFVRKNWDLEYPGSAKVLDRDNPDWFRSGISADFRQTFAEEIDSATESVLFLGQGLRIQFAVASGSWAAASGCNLCWADATLSGSRTGCCADPVLADLAERMQPSGCSFAEFRLDPLSGINWIRSELSRNSVVQSLL